MELPESWLGTTLGDIVAFDYGKALAAKNRRPGDVPVYGSNGIVGWHDEALLNGQSIIVGRKGTVGAVAWADGPCWPIDTTYYARPLRDGTELRWLYYLLGAAKLYDLGSTTGVPGLNRNDAYLRPIRVPPLGEQRKIAAILGSVDEAIERTQAVIDQVEVVKKGLMQQLLTRGMPGRHTRFKQTEIGEISESWEVVELQSLCSYVVDCLHKTPRYIAQGIPSIRTADVVPGRLLLVQAKRVSEETWTERVRRLEPKAGDVFYSREGERYGIAAPVPHGAKVCLGQRMMHFRATDRVDAAFLMWLLNSPGVYRQARLDVGGSTSPHINVGSIKRFAVPCPPLAEQIAIAGGLGCLARQVDCLVGRKRHLGRLKQALMSVLLTGELRVTPEPT